MVPLSGADSDSPASLERTSAPHISFAFVYAGGDGPLKPDPAPVAAAARALDVPPDSLWVIGDGRQDVQAARAAGATAIAVLGGFTSEARLREAAPDALLPSLAGLVELRARA